MYVQTYRFLCITYLLDKAHFLVMLRKECASFLVQTLFILMI
ncbi:hypothetical protein BMG_6426 (plasmid) [Priestia megaterium]|nr:hypothetical protein BMG_6426 [Priestia megaterium]